MQHGVVILPDPTPKWVTDLAPARATNLCETTEGQICWHQAQLLGDKELDVIDCGVGRCKQTMTISLAFHLDENAACKRRIASVDAIGNPKITFGAVRRRTRHDGQSDEEALPNLEFNSCHKIQTIPSAHSIQTIPCNKIQTIPTHATQTEPQHNI